MSPNRPTEPSSPPPMSTQAASRPIAPPFGPPAADDARLQAVVDDVAHRLRKVCADMPPAAFEALVLDIARFHLRWEDREGV